MIRAESSDAGRRGAESDRDMPNPSENLPGIYLGAASLMCLVSYFGARNRRLGWRKRERQGEVTRLWLRWIYWNRSLAPESSSEPVGQESAKAAAHDREQASRDAAWQTASAVRKPV